LYQPQYPEPQPSELPPPTPPRRRRLGRWGPWTATAAAALAKLKFLLVVLKFGTLISMLVSLALYAQVFGWAFAAGFVALLFVHEMGHYLTARRLGVPVTAPVFIPFLGAVINLRGSPQDAYREAQLAAGGPLTGIAASFALLPLAGASGLFASLAFTGFFLNLFNLLPTYPLDGGRIAGAISPWFWPLGLVLAGYLFWRSGNPILLLVLVFSLFQAGHAWKQRLSPYYQLPWGRRATVALAYFALIGLAGLGLAVNHPPGL
jgi:Zn-dependent protease